MNTNKKLLKNYHDFLLERGKLIDQYDQISLNFNSHPTDYPCLLISHIESWEQECGKNSYTRHNIDYEFIYLKDFCD
jgi:hypothetical protein